MSAAIKMDELLVSWLASDNVYENVLNLIETYRTSKPPSPPSSPKRTVTATTNSSASSDKEDDATTESPRVVVIPPFYCPPGTLNEDGSQAPTLRARHSRAHPTIFLADQSWEGIFMEKVKGSTTDSTSTKEDVPPPPPNPPSATSSLDGTSTTAANTPTNATAATQLSIREQVFAIFKEWGKARNGSALDDHVPLVDGNDSPDYASTVFLVLDDFVKVTKELCHFPSFFNGPFYKRIVYLHHLRSANLERDLELYAALEINAITVGVLDDNDNENSASLSYPNLETCISLAMLKEFWKEEMEHYDLSERFFRLLKNPHESYVGKNEFNPYIKELLKDHPVRSSITFCMFFRIPKIIKYHYRIMHVTL